VPYVKFDLRDEGCGMGDEGSRFYPSSLIPHPSSLIPHPPSPIPQPFCAVAVLPLGGEAMMNGETFIPPWAQ